MYVANDNYYCSKYNLYPFSDLNNSILNNYLSIEEKYNKIVTEYDNTIKVNMFSDNEVKSWQKSVTRKPILIMKY